MASPPFGYNDYKSFILNICATNCVLWNFFLTAQLEQVLDPYLTDTNIGIPYWNWTEDSSVPDVWEDIQSPIKDSDNFKDYMWNQLWWEKSLIVCKSHEPLLGPQTYALRIRKEEFERLKKENVKKRGGSLEEKDPFSQILAGDIKEALKITAFLDFKRKISYAHSEIHKSLNCTTAATTTAAYGLRYVI